MNRKMAMDNASFFYSANMLKILLSMNLLTEDEYDRIIKISAEYYGVKNICV